MNELVKKSKPIRTTPPEGLLCGFYCVRIYNLHCDFVIQVSDGNFSIFHKLKEAEGPGKNLPPEAPQPWA